MNIRECAQNKFQICVYIYTLLTREVNQNFDGVFSNPTNIPRGFHAETMWKRSFPRRFNVESTWCVCRERFRSFTFE